jgi:hypothetical protein
MAVLQHRRRFQIEWAVSNVTLLEPPRAKPVRRIRWLQLRMLWAYPFRQRFYCVPTRWSNEVGDVRFDPKRTLLSGGLIVLTGTTASILQKLIADLRRRIWLLHLHNGIVRFIR